MFSTCICISYSACTYNHTKQLFKHILPKRVNEPLPYYNKKPCNSKNTEDTIDDIQHVVEIDGETINHGLFFGEQDEKAYISIKKELHDKPNGS